MVLIIISLILLSESRYIRIFYHSESKLSFLKRIGSQLLDFELLRID